MNLDVINNSCGPHMHIERKYTWGDTRIEAGMYSTSWGIQWWVGWVGNEDPEDSAGVEDVEQAEEQMRAAIMVMARNEWMALTEALMEAGALPEMPAKAQQQ